MANIRIEKWTGNGALNPAMLRFRLVSEGYRVFEWCDRPEAIFPQHKHEQDQTHWVVSGALEITTGAESYILEAGDRDWLPANTWHSARVVGEEIVIYLVGEKI